MIENFLREIYYYLKKYEERCAYCDTYFFLMNADKAEEFKCEDCVALRKYYDGLKPDEESKK